MVLRRERHAAHRFAEIARHPAPVRGHHPEVVPGRDDLLVRRLGVQRHGLLEILRHAAAELVLPGKVVHRLGMAVPHRAPAPVDATRVVLRHAVAPTAVQRQFMLRVGAVAFSGLGQQRHRARHVQGHAPADAVQPGQAMHRGGVACGDGPGEQCHGLVEIGGHAFARLELAAQPGECRRVAFLGRTSQQVHAPGRIGRHGVALEMHPGERQFRGAEAGVGRGLPILLGAGLVPGSHYPLPEQASEREARVCGAQSRAARGGTLAQRSLHPALQPRDARGVVIGRIARDEQQAVTHLVRSDRAPCAPAIVEDAGRPAVEPARQLDDAGRQQATVRQHGIADPHHLAGGVGGRRGRGDAQQGRGILAPFAVLVPRLRERPGEALDALADRRVQQRQLVRRDVELVRQGLEDREGPALAGRAIPEGKLQQQGCLAVHLRGHRDRVGPRTGRARKGVDREGLPGRVLAVVLQRRFAVRHRVRAVVRQREAVALAPGVLPREQRHRAAALGHDGHQRCRGETRLARGLPPRHRAVGLEFGRDAIEILGRRQRLPESEAEQVVVDPDERQEQQALVGRARHDARERAVGDARPLGHCLARGCGVIPVDLRPGAPRQHGHQVVRQQCAEVAACRVG